jgi:hypothetical protein
MIVRQQVRRSPPRPEAECVGWCARGGGNHAFLTSRS